MDQETIQGIIGLIAAIVFAILMWFVCYIVSVRDICSGGARFYVKRLAKKHLSAWMVLNSSYPGFYKLPATVQLYCLLSLIDLDCAQVNRRVLDELGDCLDDDHPQEK